MSSEFWSALNKKKREELLGTAEREDLKTSDFISALSPEKQEELLSRGTTEISIAPTRTMKFDDDDDTTFMKADDDDIAPVASARETTWKDAFINSFSRGYQNSEYGTETFKKITGQKNEADIAKAILEQDKYQFETDNWAKKAVSGAMEQVGQFWYNLTDKDVIPAILAGAGSGAGMAVAAGQAGPQIAAPEEILTVPAGVLIGAGAGFTAHSAENALEIEAGLAYNEMLEMGVSEKTAKTIALGVGGVNAAIELIQVDELLKAFKLLNKTGASDSLLKTITKELVERGVDVAKETAQEVAQEGVTIAGVQAGSKIDTGEWAYDASEVGSRLVDTGVSSMLTFGLMNAPASVTNISSGVKANVNANKLTENEQTVVNKVYENAVAEQESDGEKLTTKEKNKLYESIVEQMDKGQLDIDTIESVLGGETYETYKNLTEQENALQSQKKAIEDEISDLVKTPELQFTVEQRERLTSLKEEAKGIKDNIKALDTKTAKSNLFNEVNKLTEKDTRLRESYNEKERRRQAFTADLTKYKGRQREAVDRAIKSGVLNNTYRSHELVDFLSYVEAEKGILFDYTNNKKLKESGFALKGKTVNGFADGNKITLNVQSPKAWQAVVGHEISHVLEGTGDYYKAMQSALFERAESKGEYQSRYDSLVELYKGVKGYETDFEAKIKKELTADLVGEYLFSDKDFINKLTGNRPLFKKVWDEVKYLCKVATGKELTEIEKVEREFARAWKEQGQIAQSEESGETRFSISKTSKIPYGEQLSQIEKGQMNGSNSLYVGKPSEQLRSVGFSDAPFAMNQSDYRKSRRTSANNKHYSSHAVPYDFFEKMPKYLSDAPLFIDNGKKVSIVTSYGMNDTRGNASYVIAGVWNNQPMESDTVNQVKSVYPLDDFAEQIKKAAEAGKLVITNKNKAEQMLSTIGIQPSEVSRIVSLAKDSIAQLPKNVNTQFSVSAKTDSDYMSAVERDDTETAQKMVDEAAKNAGYDIKAYHGTGYDFTVFDKSKQGDNYQDWGRLGKGFYFAPTSREAETWAEHSRGNLNKVMPVYLRSENMLDSFEPLPDNLKDTIPADWEGLTRRLAEKYAYNYIEYMQEFGYNVQQILTEKGYDGINGHTEFVVFDPEQVKSADAVTKDNNGNVIPLSERFNTANEDIRYSISDSEGNNLTPEQQEFFKDSKVRDDNGNLKVMYHGSPNADFTVFKSGTYFTEHKWYADLYQNQGASSLGYKKTANNPDTYAVYLDIKKPFDTRNKAERDIFYNEYYQQWGTGTDLMESGLPDWMDGQDLQEFLEEKGYDYDGLILDEGGVGGYGEEVTSRGLSYVVFSPEQVKNIDNTKPTADPDIRYSISKETDAEYMLAVKNGDMETAQRLVNEAARNSMPNSKVRDEHGNLHTVYHGSPSKFTVFDHHKLNTHGNAHGRGFYFTEDRNLAEGYEKDGGQLLKGYLNIEKPLSEEKVTIKKSDLVKLIKATCKGEAQLLVNDGGYDSVREAILDTWVSNYVDTYGTNINDVYKEVANIIYSGNDNDVDIIAEITNSGAGNEIVLKKTYEVLGYDGVIYTNEMTGKHEYIALLSNQFKSTDTVNYDDNENVIPLSERFNPDNEDIRYSLSYEGEQFAPIGNYSTPLNETALEQDIAPVATDKKTVPDVAEEDMFPSEISPVDELAQLESRIEVVSAEKEALKNEVEQLYRQNAQQIITSEELQARVEEIRPKFKEVTQEFDNLIERISSIENAEKAQRREFFDGIRDEDIPPEAEAPYYGEEFDAEDPFENRDIKAVGNQKVKAYMYENPEVKPFFQEEAGVMLRELDSTIKGEKVYIRDDEGYLVRVTGTTRRTTDDIATLLDVHHYSYDQIRKGLKAIIEDNGKENNAVSKRIEFLLNDRLLYGYRDEDGRDLPSNPDYENLLKEKQITEYNEESFKRFMETPSYFDDIAPVLENIPVLPDEELEQGTHAAIRPKPTKQPSLKKVNNAESQEHIAKVLTEEPKVEKKKKGIISTAIANFIDKGAVFENLSLKTKNRALQDTYKAIGRSETKAQYFMENGTENIKSLDAIRAEVEKTGKVQDFYNYIYHKHNIDRMNLESKERPNLERLVGEMNKFKLLHLQENQLRAIASEKITKETAPKRVKLIKTVQEYLASKDVKNKPVFDYSVTSKMSQDIVNEYEAKNPDFKEYAQDVYDYMNHLRKMMVYNGIISPETAELWAEMYPYYVPIRRVDNTGLAVNVPLDTNKTGINAPIKRATGGNSDILPLFETMAQRTTQTFKAIDKNRFGIELKDTLGGVTENTKTNLDEVIDSIDAQDSLLQEGKNGKNPTFTVFEGGDRVTFDITEEMYDALKPTSKGWSSTFKPLNTASNLHRGVLTEYSVPFMVTNAIKDAQDVLINSQHPAKTYAQFPTAINELTTKGKWYTEYMENGGGDNTYFDKQTNTFNKEKSQLRKIIGFPLDKISDANNFIEKVPRLAEYIASRESGASVDAAMLDAARVTTDFSAGGDVTKFFNRNGVTFLNASVQGFAQQVRNVREAKMNGLKGWLGLATKFAIAGLPTLLLNGALWDDDEEYEELSDYVKENYYIVGKYGDGKFVRIPKGRALAVIQNGFEQVSNALTGNDEADFIKFFKLFLSNLAPNNPFDNNILAPIKQVMENKTWYKGDLVPSRLQDLPAAEQYDESTDAISKWLGENLNVSPYKINYLLNQYSGGVGDIFLPMLTPEAESGDNSFGGNIIAPLKDKFTTDSVMNNQNVSDFYDTVDVLTKNAKSSYATDEDILKSKYINSVNTELGDLYKSKREIQNSNLSDSVKYEQVRNIQEQINNLAKNALNSYENVNVQDGYATVGDKHYRLDDGVWTKISDKQLERQKQVTSELGISPSEYWSKTNISYFPNSDGEYEYAYDNPEKYAVSKVVGGYDTYKTYSKELYNIKADKDKNGKSINGSRKEKVLNYINNLDADYETKIILFKTEYPADDTYNVEIINYINERGDLSYDERIAIFTELGFTVSNGSVYW